MGVCQEVLGLDRRQHDRLGLSPRLARAIATACAATRAISSLLTTLLLAKPQVPSTRTRTPKP